MANTAAHAEDLLARLNIQRDEVESVLRRYGASNPRLFGSVVRGDAHADSDIDLLVDVDSDAGNLLLLVADLAAKDEEAGVTDQAAEPPEDPGQLPPER